MLFPYTQYLKSQWNQRPSIIIILKADLDNIMIIIFRGLLSNFIIIVSTLLFSLPGFWRDFQTYPDFPTKVRRFSYFFDLSLL